MKLKEVTNISKLKEYLNTINIPPSDLNKIKLSGKISNNILVDELQWGIWDVQLEKSFRYSFITSIPKIILFKKIEFEGKEYSKGIVFSLNFETVIKSITINNDEMDIEVYENANYWIYSREKMSILKKVFRKYSSNIDFTINTFSDQMDSRSPAHPKTI